MSMQKFILVIDHIFCFKNISALRELKALSTKQFALPGEPTFPLGGLFPSPANKADSDAFRAYFKQAREETSIRLLNHLFNADGTKNKWWQVAIQFLNIKLF